MQRTCFYIIIILIAHSINCSHEEDKSPIVAQVGRSILTVQDLQGMIPNLNNLQLSKTQMENFVKTWVESEVIYQEALTRGLDKRPEVQEALIKVSKDYLVAYYIDHFINSNITISEDEINSYYQENMEEFRYNEDLYHVKMILVSTFGEAAEIRAQIKGVEEFAQWAQRRSMDGSRVNGGDLGYVSSSHLSPLLARAVANMRNNELSRPIKSEIGYNLLYLVECKKKELLRHS